MSPHRLVAPALALLVDVSIIVLIAWAIVSAFPITWPQAFVVSWLFHLLRDTIKFANRED
jgi:hypothetical protein